MPEKVSISVRASDFVFTTIWLSFLNYFEVYANYLDTTKRLTRSVLVAAAAGLILALIRPSVNAWLKPIIKRNKNTNIGVLIRFIVLIIFFGAFAFVSLLHLKEDSNWSMAKILTTALAIGILSGMLLSILLWLIKIIRRNKNNHPDSD